MRDYTKIYIDGRWVSPRGGTTAKGDQHVTLPRVGGVQATFLVAATPNPAGTRLSRPAIFTRPEQRLTIGRPTLPLTARFQL